VLYHGDLDWAVRSVSSFVAQQPTCGPVHLLCNDDDGTEAGELSDLLVAAGLNARCLVTSSRANVGYASGHNAAMANAFGSGEDAVLVANADLCLEPSAVAAMSELADRHGGNILVGPVLTLADTDGRDEGLLDTTGIVWSRSGRHFDHQQGEPVGNAPSVASVVAGISGACLLVPRPAYERVVAASGEFFDELFLAYREDAELGYRAGLLGVTSWVEPAARGLHARGSRGTTRSVSAAVNSLGVQNRFLIAFKYGLRRPGGRIGPWLRDIVVVAGVLARERESLPGLRRAFALRREARTKGRRVLREAR
jgi:GT2 family glycosyltransferase